MTPKSKIEVTNGIDNNVLTAVNQYKDFGTQTAIELLGPGICGAKSIGGVTIQCMSRPP